MGSKWSQNGPKMTLKSGNNLRLQESQGNLRGSQEATSDTLFLALRGIQRTSFSVPKCQAGAQELSGNPKKAHPTPDILHRPTPTVCLAPQKPNEQRARWRGLPQAIGYYPEIETVCKTRKCCQYSFLATIEIEKEERGRERGRERKREREREREG